MKQFIKAGLILIAALVLAAACELGLFNSLSVISLGQNWSALPEPEVVGNLEADRAVTLTFRGVGQVARWCHMEISVFDESGEAVPTQLILSLSDNGNVSSYYAGTIDYSSAHNKGAYFQLASYGTVHDLSVTVRTEGVGCSYVLLAAELNGSVPFRISLVRLFGLFALFLLLYALRPGSALHENRVWNQHPKYKMLIVVLLFLLNLTGFQFLTHMNTQFVEPVWVYHQQYARLARALADGQTWIDSAENEEQLTLLGELQDPYEIAGRYHIFQDHGIEKPWDTAYYQNHLYVYFGVVPVLLTYLPYYLLTGDDLPNVDVAVISFALVLIGAFVLLRALIRRYFPKTPFTVYLLLSLLFGNCTCLLTYSLMPSFYVLPITFALAFVCFALALWLSAAERWAMRLCRTDCDPKPEDACFTPLLKPGSPGAVSRRIVPGAFFAALVAGCRPQFLVFSTLSLPIFLPLIHMEPKRATTARRIVLFALPYVAVAVPLMYYNQLRFGSPFDFGANYNLTTNNMPLRGWRFSRLPDGFWQYLFHTPNIDLTFPYVHSTNSNLKYVGLTIQEWMFGGMLLLHPFLWMLLRYRAARTALKTHRLRALTLLPLALALLVIAADTEMAGILLRYTGDFLLLLYLPAGLIYLARWHDAGPARQRRLLQFLLATLLLTAFSCFLISITDSYLQSREPEAFYRWKDLLSIL